MKSDSTGKVIFVLSIPLIVLIIITSCTGILIPGFYSLETVNWQIQSIGQDIINLFVVVPVLALTAIMSFRNNRSGIILWGGTVLYLLYTFLIYCFDIHFNRLFLVYCFILGLSFYSFIYFFYTQVKKPLITEIKNNSLIRTIGIYFLILPFIFYFLWLSEILPAIINKFIPQSLVETGLLTNPVHIIDLSVFLPGIFIAGILLLRKKQLGFILAPIALLFFVLMDITIGGLVIIMNLRGLQTNMAVTVVMSVLEIFSITLLFWYLNEVKKSNNE